MKYVYFDTSAIIDLARHRTVGTWKRIDNMLRDGNHTLVLSTTHLYDFSKGRMEEDCTAIYLDSLPLIQWVIPPWYIWRREVKSAINFCLTKKTHHFQLYYTNFLSMYTAVNRKYRHLQYSLQQPKSIAETINSFKKDKVYKETEEIAKHCTEVVRKARESSIIWQSWQTVLRQHVSDFWPQHTVSGLKIEKNVAFIDDVLALADFCMPSLVFTTKLQRIKFSKKEHVEPNDFIDEFHASFAPYCAAVMHDKATCRRAQETSCRCAARFTANADELLHIIGV